ncbi:enoyl-CoA hydratase/isomerase family protein [Desulfosoma sp.]
MTSPAFRHLRLQEQERILWLFVANPPDNRLSRVFFQDLAAALDVMAQERFRACVITGEGRNFSKGADLHEIQTAPDQLTAETLAFGNSVFTQIAHLNKPVVAAINGACFGGGLELALACPLRVCSENARLGLPELTAGVIPGLGGIVRLIRVVGEPKALEMILMGDLVSAQTAKEIHLVNRVFPKKDFLSAVGLWVKTLLGAPQACIGHVLDLVAQTRARDEAQWIASAAERFLEMARRLALKEATLPMKNGDA